MTSITPLIKYSFESWTRGSTTIINEGSSGTVNDGVLQNSAIVISSDYAVGGHSLMVGNRGSTGAYSYLSISGNVSLSSNFTICFWHKCLATFADGGIIFNFQNSSGYSFIFSVKNGTNTFNLFCYDQNGYNLYTYPTTNISTNTWHHYAFVSSSIDGTF